MMRVACLDDYQSAAGRFMPLHSLQSTAQVSFFHEKFANDELARQLADFDAVILMRERSVFGPDMLERLPKLRLIVTTGMRNNSIDLEAAKRLGIAVYGTQALGYPAAELAWGLLLALARKIPQEVENLKAGRWQRTVGVGLHGKTLGIVGLGRLGQQVARFGRAFGMRVLAWSTNLTAEICKAHDVDYAAKEELLASSDVVSLHLVLSERSRGIIGASDLALMKPSAILVNTSRSGLVDQKALVAALANGRLGGVGLDVFDDEPISMDNPLISLGNVVLTPHLGYVTEENYRIFFEQAAEDILNFVSGNDTRRIA